MVKRGAVNIIEAMQTHPLSGLLVVSVEQAVAAPLCTARLADAGARVIKIERPGGDFARGYDAAVGGDSTYFAWANHGKESVVLDFDRDDDMAVVASMLEAADVFVQNLAPGALARRGLGSAQLRERHPRLITVDISGYGEEPPLDSKRAYDLLVQAESGVISVSGPPGELGRIGISLCDIGTGVTAHAAVLEALVARSITGLGSGIAISLFDVMAEWMTVPLALHEAGAPPRRVGLKHPSIAPYGAFATSEGTLTLISIQNEREWVRLCNEVLEAPDMAVDPRFDSNLVRVQNRAELESRLGEIVSSLSRDEFQSRLQSASIAFGTVSDLDDLSSHAALRRREVISSSGIAAALPAHPVRFVGMAHGSAPRVPAVGQHSEEIRAEFAPTATGT